MNVDSTAGLSSFSLLFFCFCCCCCCVSCSPTKQKEIKCFLPLLAENVDGIALCGDTTIFADVVTFDYVEGDVPTHPQECSCDVSAADGGVVSMAVSVSIKYTSSCPGLRLKVIYLLSHIFLDVTLHLSL